MCVVSQNLYAHAALALISYTRRMRWPRFISLLLAAGVYREYVLEELLQPDQDVHVSFRRIGRGVFLATKGKQQPVWRSHFYIFLYIFFQLRSCFVVAHDDTNVSHLPTSLSKSSWFQLSIWPMTSYNFIFTLLRSDGSTRLDVCNYSCKILIH